MAQKKGKGCKRREPRPTKRHDKIVEMRGLGFITNTFTDIARKDDRDLHNDSSAEHENAWVGNQGANFLGSCAYKCMGLEPTV